MSSFPQVDRDREVWPVSGVDALTRISEEPGKPSIYIVCFTGSSGLTDYSVSLCKALSDQAKVSLITAKSFNAHGLSLDFQVEKFFNRSRYFPLDLLRFLLLSLRERPRVVLFQSPMKFPLVEAAIVPLLRVFGIQVALTVHDDLPHAVRPWSRFSHSLYYRRFKKTIVHSVRSLENLRSMGCTADCKVVKHGVYDLFDIDKLSREEGLQAFPAEVRSKFLILYFGHIETRKGIFSFLECAAHMRDDNRYLFVIAGRNDLSHAERERFDRYRDLHNIVIHDHRIPHERVQFYFAAVHLVALPYEEGTTSGVLKIAMAFRRPVVATDVGDLSENIRPHTGIVIPAEGDTAMLMKDAIREIHSSYREFEQGCAANLEELGWPAIGATYAQFLLD